MSIIDKLKNKLFSNSQRTEEEIKEHMHRQFALQRARQLRGFASMIERGTIDIDPGFCPCYKHSHEGGAVEYYIAISGFERK